MSHTYAIAGEAALQEGRRPSVLLRTPAIQEHGHSARAALQPTPVHATMSLQYGATAAAPILTAWWIRMMTTFCHQHSFLCANLTVEYHRKALM